MASSTCSRSPSWAATGTGPCTSSAASGCCSVPIGTLLLVYLTVLKLTGEAIGHRPLLTLGVLLVVVGVQLVSLGLVSELVASHHEERAAATGAPSCTWTRSCADLRVLYFGTYERDYPRNAQVISCLRGAGAEVIERHASVWERRRHNWSVGLGAAARVGVAEARLLARQPAASASTPSSSAIRATSTCPPPSGSRAAGPFSSTRSSRSTRRSSRIAAASAHGSPGRRDPPSHRPDRTPARRPRRRGHGAERTPPRRARRAARRAAGGLLRRRRGTALPPGVAAGRGRSTRSSSAS